MMADKISRAGRFLYSCMPVPTAPRRIPRLARPRFGVNQKNLTRERQLLSSVIIRLPTRQKALDKTKLHRLVFNRERTFMIHVAALLKKFGDFTAVNDVSFDVAQGEIFAFLGPNGAGKTTTIKMLTTLLTPTSGVVEIDGLDVRTQGTEVRKRFGIVFQDPSLDGDMTGAENMELHGVFYHVPRKVRLERTEYLLRLFELWDRRNDLVKKFSGGMKRRLEIARGFAAYAENSFSG